jgi:hypothetical protein
VRRGAITALAIALFAITAHQALIRHAGSGACPFGYGARPAPHHLADLRGPTAARTRPALGFALDHTTAAELTRWATDHALHCAARRGGTTITCDRVPAAALAAGADLELTRLVLRIAADGTLDSIEVVRRQPDPRSVAAAFTAIDRELAASGPAWTRQGAAAPEALAAALLRQAAVEYRFTDYRAVVRATNLGDGFVLSEEYASLVDRG